LSRTAPGRGDCGRARGFALAALACLAAASAGGASDRAAPDATARDSGRVESEPAPLLVPGRPGPVDTAAISRAGRARRQYELGLAFERDGQAGAAIAAYSNAVKLDPAIADANVRMGRLLVRRDELAHAAQAFADEVRHHPGNDEAIRELAVVLTRLGETGRAIQHLERLAKRRPRDGAVWHALGYAYLAAERPRNAETALRRALSLAPASFEAHRDLAAALSAQGRDTESRAELERALALMGRDPTSWFNLGNLERRAGRPDSALALYRRAESFDSSFVAALQSQIRILRDAGRDGEAAGVYRRWLRHHPTHHGTRLEAVRLLEAMDRPDEALELARDGVRAQNDSPQPRILLALVLKSRGELRRAMAELRAAEALLRGRPGAELDRVRRLIATTRAAATDSLRNLFAADSAAAMERRARGTSP
jgi:tetratricopeptide (TPR) repeat protein